MDSNQPMKGSPSAPNHGQTSRFLGLTWDEIVDASLSPPSRPRPFHIPGLGDLRTQAEMH